MKSSKDEQSCMNFKLMLITEILNARCENNKSLDFITPDWNRYILVGKPMSLEMYTKCKKKFENYFCNKQECKVVSKFIISKNEINRIVNDNIEKNYMHIFFTDNHGILNIIFRFSDIEEFDYQGGNLDLGDDKAYQLQTDGFVEDMPAIPSFTSIVENFREGVVNNLIMATLQKYRITEYIVYKMEAIRAFEDFEDNLEFETIVFEESDQHQRLGLAVYIKDSNRIHHIELDELGKLSPVYDGYYDLGNLKP